ncbi:MAG: glycosyltransferase family 4 protein [Anaerotignum faecicola]|uniref:glycosyltransferase family 4 protein n=1 Tax=Clostridium sp. MCC345 TaxID=2592645 RepID=UPI001C019D3B|nr:glycosyltransferase [Clostridium sp. MCC345]
MNIGIFSDTYFPQLNGVATSIRTLTHALREKGHTVYIFTPSDPRCEGQPEDEDIFRLPSIPVYFVRDYRAGYIFPPHILKKIKKLNLDIVHTQTEFPLGFLGKLVSTTEGIPMVHTYHTMYEDYVHYIGGGHIISKNMAREFSSAFCNTAMAVIAPTHKTEQLLSGYGVTKPISIIPTGINTAHFRKENFDAAEILALRESLGLKADTPVIISIGRIAKEKSIDVVISALPKLIEKLPEVQMVIVGEGNEIENLRNFAESLGVGAHVMFTGGKPWDEIGKYYQLGNVFCSASVSETQGLTFAEAMAGGIPVVAKKDECIENIITDGETGMLFEKNENLPELLYRVLTDKSLSEKLSTASIQAMDVLSVQNFADSVEQLYQNILEQEERPKPIAAPVIPFVIGAKAAKGITGLPGKISRTYLKKAANFLSSAKGE